ncbi:hypothetical protein [Scytonema sp. PRP1]|uniref:hypothetical protein n=1 Tax=Scytonema sp. PRP1 TaxID=3120513 RepID=UPI00300C2973
MKYLRYHMVLQGMSNLLNTTVVVKAKALGPASQTIMEQTPHEGSNPSIQGLNISATAKYDQINFEEGDTHLAYILQSSPHNEVVFEAHVTQFDNGLFQQTGRILFGGISMCYTFRL